MNKKLKAFILSGSATPIGPIAGLTPTAWFDNGSTYMAADGSSWIDRMGNYNLAGTAKPSFTASALGNKPSFTFDGVNDILSGSRMTQLSGASKATFWMVGQRAAMGQDDGSGNSFNLYNFSDDVVYGQSKKATVATSGSIAAVPNLYHYIVLIYDGTQATNAAKLKIYINGIAQTLSFSGTIPATLEGDAASILKLGSVFGNFWAMNVCEAGIVAGTAIDATAISNLNSYLEAKYLIPSLFTPIAWWRNGSDYMASDGSAWTDFMGHYSLTATGTAKPTFNASAVNSLPSFSFDGVNDQMTGARITEIQGKSGNTWVTVEKRGIISHDDNTLTNNNNLYHNVLDAVVSNPADNLNRGTVAGSNAYLFNISVFDGTLTGNDNRLKIWLNGVAQTVAFTGNMPTATESNASSIIRIGQTGNVFWAGEMVEAMVFNRALNTSEIAALNSYLSSRYAL